MAISGLSSRSGLWLVTLPPDRLPKFNGFLGTQRLGLGVADSWNDENEVLRDSSAHFRRKLLQHAGSVAAVTTEQVARIGLLHRADLAGAQVVDLDSRERIKDRAELRNAGGGDQEQSIGKRGWQRRNGSIFDLARADAEIVPRMQGLFAVDSTLFGLHFVGAAGLGANSERVVARLTGW